MRLLAGMVNFMKEDSLNFFFVVELACCTNDEFHWFGVKHGRNVDIYSPTLLSFI